MRRGGVVDRAVGIVLPRGAGAADPGTYLPGSGRSGGDERRARGSGAGAGAGYRPGFGPVFRRWLDILDSANEIGCRAVLKGKTGTHSVV